MKLPILKLIVFFSGALTMIFELAGTRVMGPFLGTSIIVWTALIGIIMGGLALGYTVGGYYADKYPKVEGLGWVLFLAALCIILTTFADEYILLRLHKYVDDLRLRSVLACILLFGPANIFLGMVLPFAAKIEIAYIKTSGQTIGNIYALSSLGSIAGIFSAGFYIIPVWGHYLSLVFMTIFILMLSLTFFLLEKKYISGLSFIAGIILLISGHLLKSEKAYLDINTRYNRVIVRDEKLPASNQTIRWLFINDERSSAMYLENDELVFDVLRFYHLAEHFNHDFDTTLMIGGSGYAYPKSFLKRYPDACMDVVEIDPGLTDIAREYFNLEPNPRLKIIHEDGRTYINHCLQKYDVIYLDAYKSVLTVPYQLTTAEAIQQIYNLLNEDGIVLANLIGNFNPEKNHFLRAEIKTFQSVFPQVYLFAVQDPTPAANDKDKYQNFMLIAMKSANELLPATNADSLINQMLSHRIDIPFHLDLPVLTDEYSPVDFYTFKALK